MFILCIVAVFLVIRRLRFVAGNASDAGRKEMSK
jgi:hypothetical protein